MSNKPKRFMPFEEAIRSIIKEGDKINPYALYPNDGKEVILYSEETGYSERQIIGRDKNLEFFFSFDKEGVPMFWGRTTSKKVILSGEKGAANGISTVHKACQPWSNLSIGLKARATLKEDIDFLKKNTTTEIRLKEDKNIAWLGSDCVNIYSDDSADFNMHYIKGTLVCEHYLYYSCGIEYDPTFGVRPAVSVHLKSKILVDLEKSKETGIWQLIPNEC